MPESQQEKIAAAHLKDISFPATLSDQNGKIEIVSRLQRSDDLADLGFYQDLRLQPEDMEVAYQRTQESVFERFELLSHELMERIKPFSPLDERSHQERHFSKQFLYHNLVINSYLK